MRILFYTSFNSRSRDTESLMEGFIKDGHAVYLLTQKEKGEYHSFATSLGVKTFSLNINRRFFFIYIFLHWANLIYFCWRHKINIIYAHLEEPGLAAVFSQYFVRSKIIVCRHIVDEAYLFNNRNFILLNKIVYRLAHHVVVVSNRAKTFMVEKEKINPQKIHCIPLGYNFEFYNKPNTPEVEKIKKEFNSDFLIITACRLVPAKRPLLSIYVAEVLIKNGYNIKLIILGDGPQKDELKQYIKINNLSDSIYILGFKNNIIDYLDASHILLHPSILDSSSVIIKEAGLLKKIVVTCKDVGDVNEYLKHGINSYLVNREKPNEEMINVLENIIKNNTEEKNNILGINLQSDILKLFDIKNALTLYKELHLHLES